MTESEKKEYKDRLVRICDTVIVNPLDISAIEVNDRHDWVGGDFSGYSTRLGDGTCITLKNGRKIYVPLHIDQVIEKITAKDAEKCEGK